MKKISLLIFFALVVGSLFAQNPAKKPNDQRHFTEPVESMAPDFSSDIEAVFAKKEQEAMIWRALQDARPSDIAVEPIILAPSDEAFTKLALAQCETCPVEDEKLKRLLGVNQAIDLPVVLRDEMAAKRGTGIGHTVRVPSGDLVWTSSLISEGASAIRVRFVNVNLGDNATLFVYNDFGQAFGPYTGTGPHGNGKFWSHTVHGDQVWIQLHVAAGTDVDAISFDIAMISHMGDGFEGATTDHRLGKADCNRNVSCVENAQCYTSWSELSGARKATAYLIYSEDSANGNSYGCSGGTMNDNNGSHRKAWLLTANHCISSENEADSVEARFGYKSNSCGTCSSSISDSVLGADIRATGNDGDFTLLELSGLPSGWGLLGWTNATVRTDDGLQLYRISHPKGSPQSFSQHEVDTSKWSNSKKIFSLPVIGTPEGQSSGSPIFKAGGTVVGQLIGVTYTGSSYDLCEANPSTWRYGDGALSYYWKSVRPYLASGSSTSYKMHVSAVSAGTSSVSIWPFKFYRGKATVTVVDELGNAVPNVTVTGQFSNGLGGTFSATTNYLGKATIIDNDVNTSKPGFTFCVTNLSHGYFNTYDSGANTTTCASR